MMRVIRTAGAVLLTTALAAGAVCATAAPASAAVPVDEAPRVGGPAISGIRFATYNVRTGGLNNKWAGDPDSHYDADDARRMKRVAWFIKDRKLDVVAVQEVRGGERHGIMSNLPKNYFATGVVGRSDTAVIWNNQVWKHLDTGRYNVPIRKGISRPQVWVKLHHRQSHRVVVVFSLHLAAGDREQFRIEGAKRTVDAVRRVARSKGHPFIVAGDINGTDRNRIGAYRVFKNAGLEYTREHTDRRFGNHCDSHNRLAGTGRQECRQGRGSHIDHVWVSRDFHSRLYNLVANRQTSFTSDHNPLVTVLRLAAR